MAGKQVKLFLVEGTPGGLTTAEITNWTGHIVIGPRSRLADLLARDEAKRTGVYLLLGDDPEAPAGVRCYIGEADEVQSRLKEHHSVRGKEFWDRVVVITSKDANLTKSHCRYLEARLIALAFAAGRSLLDNNTKPPTPLLPEADVSDMDYFIDQLKIVLPVLGVNVLRGRGTTTVTSASTADIPAVLSPEFHLTVPKRGIFARAMQVDGEFTVLEGSIGASEVRTGAYARSTTAAYDAFRDLHHKLVDDGSLTLDGSTATFRRDVVFSSPSTAGAIVTGRSCNGRVSWVTDDGLTFGEWEQLGVSGEQPPTSANVTPPSLA